MSLKGNKGEWSEVYALLKVLADGKLYGADADLNEIQDLYYNILEVIRMEKDKPQYHYQRNDTDVVIVDEDNNELFRCNLTEFETQAQTLFNEIKRIKGQDKNTIPMFDEFLESIKVTVLKAPSITKGDITIQIHDIYTGAKPILEFSIKSQLGSASTLLNAGKSTNLVFKLESPLCDKEIEKINKLSSPGDKITQIELHSQLQFYRCSNDTFSRNLRMIDSNMPKIIANLVYLANKNKTWSIEDLLSNDLSLDEEEKELIKYKVKQLLVSAALGMKPSSKWDGYDEATGGYIVVKNTGDLVCYHLYNRNALKDFLFKNTKFENASQTRHDFGKIYVDNDGNQYFNLNLQIRFKK